MIFKTEPFDRFQKMNNAWDKIFYGAMLTEVWRNFTLNEDAVQAIAVSISKKSYTIFLISPLIINNPSAVFWGFCSECEVL